MIEFSGIVSKKIQRQLIKQIGSAVGVLGLLATCFGAAATIGVSIDKGSITWEFLAPTIVVAVITAVLFLAPQIVLVLQSNFNWHYTIRIENGMITKIQSGKKEIAGKVISRVKKVIDYGEYYLVKFRGFNQSFFCQKNLLTSGTLEEFEKLFEDKLKRKEKPDC